MPDNFERGDRAMRAMEAYRGAGGASDEEGVLGLEGSEEFGWIKGYPIGDLFADLLHLCARYDVDGPAMMAQGMEHYGADLIEQAWEHSDDWDDTMQSPANLTRAQDILEINNVPLVFWGDIMVKVGLVSPDDRDDYQEAIS